jgi:2-dehydropantoate 2-reductase
MGVTMVGPGKVRPGGEGPIFLPDRPDVTGIIKILQQAGFKVRKVSNIDSMVWGKLVVSAAVNPLTALLGIKNGDLLSLPAAQALVKMIVSETISVAEAMQVRLPYRDAYKEVETVIQQTAGNYSSMLQDIFRGSRTEIDAINGALVELANSKDLVVPINLAVTSLIRALPGHGKIEDCC